MKITDLKQVSLRLLTKEGEIAIKAYDMVEGLYIHTQCKACGCEYGVDILRENKDIALTEEDLNCPLCFSKDVHIKTGEFKKK